MRTIVPGSPVVTHSQVDFDRFEAELAMVKVELAKAKEIIRQYARADRLRSMLRNEY